MWAECRPLPFRETCGRVFTLDLSRKAEERLQPGSLPWALWDLNSEVLVHPFSQHVCVLGSVLLQGVTAAVTAKILRRFELLSMLGSGGLGYAFCAWAGGC